MIREILFKIGAIFLIISSAIVFLGLTVIINRMNLLLMRLGRTPKFDMFVALRTIPRFKKLAAEKGTNQKKYQRYLITFKWSLRIALCFLVIGLGLMLAGKELE